ncbi:MAG: DUF4270 domain-containing protein [Tannerella sp.]|jgi:hypothetical protein|nr:DUF4270 domain-containing protein [Tannerella sp.]
MNIKPFVGICAGVAGIFLSSCNDAINQVGPSILPDEDRITVYADTFQLTASTVKLDSVFAKTAYGYLGEFYDPLYGRLKSDYLCQFYCQENFQFSRTPYEGKIDSVFLYLEYSGWTGDAYTPMEVQIYPVTKQLNKIYYANIQASDYSDMQNRLASQVVSASNGIISGIQSISTAGDTSYYHSFEIRLPVELGQKIYDETQQNPSTFRNQETFNQFFPGLYVTTGYGSGTVFHVEDTRMMIRYRYAETSSTGVDSLVSAVDGFRLTKDVIQLNRFENTDTEQLLEDHADCTYLKTPAGIFTRLVIPAREIREVIQGRMINNLPLELKYLPQEEWLYALAPPSHLLLLPEDSLRSFFENSNIENSVFSYISTPDGVSSPTASGQGYNPTTRTYSFRNIANLLSYHLATSPDEDLRMLVVPVNRICQTYSNSSSYYYDSSSTTYYTTAISPYLAPSGLKLRKDNMQIVILSSRFTNKVKE